MIQQYLFLKQDKIKEIEKHIKHEFKDVQIRKNKFIDSEDAIIISFILKVIILISQRIFPQ